MLPPVALMTASHCLYMPKMRFWMFWGMACQQYCSQCHMGFWRDLVYLQTWPKCLQWCLKQVTRLSSPSFRCPLPRFCYQPCLMRMLSSISMKSGHIAPAYSPIPSACQAAIFSDDKRPFTQMTPQIFCHNCQFLANFSPQGYVKTLLRLSWKFT